MKIALFLISLGFGFKISAVPFHRATGISQDIYDKTGEPGMSWFICAECVSAHGLGEP